MRSSGVPLGHKLIAVVVAVATACGLYAFLHDREAQLASSASLTFDSAEAQQLDPGIMRVPHPAVVLGQAILSDAMVSRLVPQAGLPASASTALAIGEFRNRLELTQPTAGLLYVRYRDPDPGQAAATANAVAEALSAWTPSGSSAPPPAGNAQPSPTPRPAPPPTREPAPAGSQNHPAGPALAASFGDLAGQLSAANQRVGPGSPLQSEHDRQRYLEAQVRDVQQKLGDLRGEFAHSGTAAQGSFDAIQHALALIWPSAAGLNTAGTSESQLRYEREQVFHAVDVIAQQRQAAQRAEAAQSAPVHPPAQTAPPVQQPQPAPTEAAAPPPASVATWNPLHLDRMAGIPARVVWWPSALVGCFCGLLYWGFAFARYHSSGESDDLLDLAEESAPSAYRLITPDTPGPAARPAEAVELSPEDSAAHKRASFSFEPASVAAPVADQATERVNAPIQTSLQAPVEAPVEAAVRAPVQDAVPDRVAEIAAAEAVVVQPEAERAETESSEAPCADPLAAQRREPDEVFREKVVEIADPWAEEVRQNLSHTTIGRMLDALIMEEERAAARREKKDEAPAPSHSDRLAG